MWLLLIIGTLIPVVLIGFYVAKLDKFLEKGGFKKAEDEIHTAAVVLGSSALAQDITVLLQKSKIQVFPLHEPILLEQGQNFRYLFALSERDADNIVICKICRRLYGTEKMISLCSDRLNERMFVSERIRYMPYKEATAQMLYQLVLTESEVSL